MVLQQDERPKRIVTLELMRKRAEHNEGLVSNLEELALHQENLEGIGPVLGRTCGKTLQILMLQNNVISSLPHGEMKWFKSLRYLNLALNNITHMEEFSLSGCESLEKLDLTLNFIHLDGLRSLSSNLSQIQSFRELYLVGNPCIGVRQSNDEDNASVEEFGPTAITTKGGWRYCAQYIIATIPHLQKLDGALISQSDRIKARQLLPIMEEELSLLIQERKKERSTEASTASSATADDDKDDVSNGEATSTTLTNHSPKERAKTCEDAAKRKLEKEYEEKKRFPKPKGELEWEQDQRHSVQREKDLEAQGIVRQRNEGKWDFAFDEESRPGFLLLNICIAKHLSSSLLDVDVHPTYISVIIKSKVLRLVLPVEVNAEESRAERSATSGHLLVIMPKVKPHENVLVMAKQRHKQHSETSVCHQKNQSTPVNASPTCTTRKQQQNMPLGRQILEEQRAMESISINGISNLEGENQALRKPFVGRKNLKEIKTTRKQTTPKASLVHDNPDTDSDDDDDPPALC